MAHKSHRQKALQAQLAPEPEISIVKPKVPKVKKVVEDAPPADGMDVDDDDDEVLIAPGPSSAPGEGSSSSGFAPLPASAQTAVLKNEFRRVPIPPHRMTPLKREWVNLYTPLVEMLGLQVRMNVKRRAVEIKVSGVLALLTVQSSPHTVDSGAVQKGADFVKAFALGFDVNVRDIGNGLTPGRYCPFAFGRLVH